MAQTEHEVVHAGTTVDEAPLDLSDEIKARGYWESVWLTLKKDKAAVGGGITVIILILLCFVGAPIFAWILGHGPDQIFDGGLTSGALPLGPWSHFKDVPYIGATGNFPTVFFPLGSDGAQGRDEFLRLLYGGRASLEVAIFATAISITLGVVCGAAAGYFGGWIDMIISRVTELTMAFPVILFIIALSAVAGPQLNKITFGFLPNGVFTITMVLSIFGWFYPARIARAQVLSLREKEFVEAARMVGSSDHKIIRSHLLPAPGRPDDRAGDDLGRRERPRRGWAVLPRDRDPGSDGELGEPARRGAEFLPPGAVADALAGPHDPDHDALLQPARRRPPGRLRPARRALKWPCLRG